MQELLIDLSRKIPSAELQKTGTHAFSVNMDKLMGKEGLSSLVELTSKGVINTEQIRYLEQFKDQVFEINLNGTEQEKKDFINQFNSTNLNFPIFFQLIRGRVIVPCIRLEKQNTTSLFVAMGPLNDQRSRELYTLAPGRYMPRHPDASQHIDARGNLNLESFLESSNAWFYTIMLVD